MREVEQPVPAADEVYGEAAGTFAEFVCAKDSETDLTPADLPFEQAAAMPLAANTALIGLRDMARVRAGQSVLVNGASGGVGTFAVQLATAYGAEVTGVCGARNVELVGSLGADQIVDCTREDFTRAGRRYDVVLDLVGNRSPGELAEAGKIAPAVERMYPPGEAAKAIRHLAEAIRHLEVEHARAKTVVTV
ncbi:NAD(P)-dependent alcohol dehydrogenase [Streptomyces sviceus]|uniref:NAD(P)-dependent alcohol dehydrogenase n=1 Tax=Streptomyces sviceus TaxID=285530 RepID=UPI0036E940E0